MGALSLSSIVIAVSRFSAAASLVSGAAVAASLVRRHAF
jgi:hypothetical protein